MAVSLTPQLEAMIRERVASGRHADASEVVGEALRLLDERERLDHLRSLLAVAQAGAKVGARSSARGAGAGRSHSRLPRPHRRAARHLLPSSGE